MCEGHHHEEGSGCGCGEGHGYREGEHACRCGEHHGHGEEHGRGCGCGGQSGHHDESHCSCGCHGASEERGFQRRFRTREERIAELATYLKELEAESQGVREAIAGLLGPQPSTPSQP